VAENPPSPWDIDEGIRNAEAFFRLLARILPDATLFVAEGLTRLSARLRLVFFVLDVVEQRGRVLLVLRIEHVDLA